MVDSFSKFYGGCQINFPLLQQRHDLFYDEPPEMVCIAMHFLGGFICIAFKQQERMRVCIALVHFVEQVASFLDGLCAQVGEQVQHGLQVTFFYAPAGEYMNGCCCHG